MDRFGVGSGVRVCAAFGVRMEGRHLHGDLGAIQDTRELFERMSRSF